MAKLLLIFCLAATALCSNAQEILGVTYREHGPVLTPLIKTLATTNSQAEKAGLLIDCADHYFDNTDSATYYLNLANQLNHALKIDSLQTRIDLAADFITCRKSHTKDPEPLFLPLIKKLQKSGDKLNELRAWSYCRMQVQLDPDLQLSLAENLCLHIVSLCNQLGRPDDSLVVMRYIADIHLQQNKILLSEKELISVVAGEEKIHSPNLVFAYDLLSAVYTKKGELNKALDYALRTVKTLPASKDSVHAGTYYSRLVQIYYVLNDYPSALYWSKMCLEKSIALHHNYAIYTLCSDIITLLLVMGKTEEANRLMSSISYQPVSIVERMARLRSLGDISMAQKKMDNAEKYYLEMSNMEQVDSDGNHSMQTYNCLARYYFNTGKFVLSKKNYQHALQMAKVSGSVDLIKKYQMNVFKADSALGDYQSAMEHLEAYNKLKDSLFNENKNKQIQELQIAYQVSEKNNDLNALKSKEQLEQLELAKATNTRNWILAATFMMIIIAGLLFRQGIIRKKATAAIAQKNALLQQTVTEKEWLLKEVHHRVKNNLHTIICLLESQALYLENDALKAIENSQHRIYAMSLIHQKLYQTGNVQSINMSNYISEFVQYLEDSFGAPANIHIRASIEPIELGISQAIPLGLIINEAVTNCFKYAFPGGRNGQIDIVLKNAGNQISLVIADNGIGFNSENDNNPSGTLGIALIKGLTGDVGGTIDFSSNKGTTIAIRFKKESLQVMEDMLQHPVITANQDIS